MSRPFDFNWSVQQASRLRQHGQCACCGDNLDDVLEHAHHVVPNQSGNAAEPSHQWLRSADNCVVLCEMCHWRVHENGRYRQGAVAPAGYFPYSHGGDGNAHHLWNSELTRRGNQLWSPSGG